MGVINVKISDETEAFFRMELLKRWGSKKGVMGEQVDIALINWVHRPVWVQDLEESKAERYIKLSEEINPKLKYFTGEAVRDKGPGMVGIYYILRPGAEP